MKRYKLEIPNGMVEDKDGLWVNIFDHDKEIKELKELLADAYDEGYYEMGGNLLARIKQALKE